MDAGLIERIETSAERTAAALFAGAIGYACCEFLIPLIGQGAAIACGAGAAAIAFFPCWALLGVTGQRDKGFALPAFELRGFELAQPGDELLLTDADRLKPAGELVLTEADRLVPTGELLLTEADRLDRDEPLVLDDILTRIGPEARVVRLFDQRAMPTPGQLKSRIDGRLGPAKPTEAPVDASQALSAALAELRRSLR
jgi:hypothetical protein